MEKEITWIDKILEDLIITFQKRWRIFLLSLVTQFILASLLHLGLQVPKELSFLSLPDRRIETSQLATPQQRPPNVLDIIRPKLEQKPNIFRLEKESSFIPSAYAAADYEQASGYIVVDLESGKVIISKDSNHQIPIASITKVMTTVVALDLASPGESFTVSRRAALIPPTKINVVPGQQVKLGDLLQAALMSSANDATQVIADGVNNKYGSKVFVKAMNEKAKFLGLKSSYFTNPQGFDDLHPYSSAEDVAVFSAYALQNYPLIREIVGMDYQVIPADGYHDRYDLHNWNGLLGVYPGIYGVKIGNTDGAGYTTVVASERDGQKVLVVLLGAPGVLERDLWAAGLLDAGFAKLGLDPANVTEFDLRAKYATWR